MTRHGADFGNVIDDVVSYLTPQSVKDSQAASTALSVQQAQTQKMIGIAALVAAVGVAFYVLKKKK